MLLTQINYHLQQLQTKYGDVKRDPTLPNNVPNTGPRLQPVLPEPPATAKKPRLSRAELREKKEARFLSTLPDLDVVSQPAEETPQPVKETPKAEVKAPQPLLDSGVFTLEPKLVFDLANIFAKYMPKEMGKHVASKSMGLPVPLDLHERMVEFLSEHKAEENSPQSLRELGLMCLAFAMENMPKAKKV